MADDHNGDHFAQLDRSNCILPSSSSSDCSIQNEMISIDLNLPDHRKDINVPTLDEGSIHTLLKACWILTLQCFIIADVICFTYSGPLNQGKDGKARPDTPGCENKRCSVLYFTRLDLTETVWSFLQRLAGSHQNASISANGFGIGIVDARSPQHHCNTGISISESLSDVKSSNPVDVHLVVGGASSSKSIHLVYNASHTSAHMAMSILRTFTQIYSQVSLSSSCMTLNDIDVCADHDRKKIRSWTYMDPKPADSCLHDLILKQCLLRPDDLAIRSWDGNMTYRKLDEASLRLSNYLVKLGVGPEVFVLSCFEKSRWAIVARLAILRAGGAYISIFANDPPAYLESVIARTKTSILITDPCHMKRFQGIVPTLIDLSPSFLETLPTDPQPCKVAVQPDNACLVLFTSGSTGAPKGIIQSHQAYATAIKNYSRDLHLDSRTRFLLFDDYAFDISNLEFLVPLILGGCCCVPGPIKTTNDLTREINDLDATILFLTPTVAIKMESRDVPRLKTLCVGGEPLPKELVAKWKDADTVLVNQYGMGEVAICCALNIGITTLNNGAVVGKPSTGTLWIANSSAPDKLMPIGAVGEIMVEGPHLSRGYLDNTSTRRTEAGFLRAPPPWLSDMHPERIQSRVYRSGDLGRLNHDGSITYLGRKDTILKLDGCRIDALEVEYQAKKCLSDNDHILIDLLGTVSGGDDPSLAALIYLHDHPDCTAPARNSIPLLKDASTDEFAKGKIEEMRNCIAQSLPHYMMPTIFVLMSWLPRTASKKVDRKKIHMLGEMFYVARYKKAHGHDGSMDFKLKL